MNISDQMALSSATGADDIINTIYVDALGGPLDTGSQSDISMDITAADDINNSIMTCHMAPQVTMATYLQTPVVSMEMSSASNNGMSDYVMPMDSTSLLVDVQDVLHAAISESCIGPDDVESSLKADPDVSQSPPRSTSPPYASIETLLYAKAAADRNNLGSSLTLPEIYGNPCSPLNPSSTIPRVYSPSSPSNSNLDYDISHSYPQISGIHSITHVTPVKSPAIPASYTESHITSLATESSCLHPGSTAMLSAPTATTTFTAICPAISAATPADTHPTMTTLSQTPLNTLNPPSLTDSINSDTFNSHICGTSDQAKQALAYSSAASQSCSFISEPHNSNRNEHDSQSTDMQENSVIDKRGLNILADVVSHRRTIDGADISEEPVPNIIRKDECTENMENGEPNCLKCAAPKQVMGSQTTKEDVLRVKFELPMEVLDVCKMLTKDQVLLMTHSNTPFAEEHMEMTLQCDSTLSLTIDGIYSQDDAAQVGYRDWQCIVQTGSDEEYLCDFLSSMRPKTYDAFTQVSPDQLDISNQLDISGQLDVAIDNSPYPLKSKSVDSAENGPSIPDMNGSAETCLHCPDKVASADNIQPKMVEPAKKCKTAETSSNKLVESAENCQNESCLVDSAKDKIANVLQSASEESLMPKRKRGRPPKLKSAVKSDKRSSATKLGPSLHSTQVLTDSKDNLEQKEEPRSKKSRSCNSHKTNVISAVSDPASFGVSVKRGRGRPPKNRPPDKVTEPEDTAETSEGITKTERESKCSVKGRPLKLKNLAKKTYRGKSCDETAAESIVHSTSCVQKEKQSQENFSESQKPIQTLESSCVQGLRKKRLQSQKEVKHDNILLNDSIGGNNPRTNSGAKNLSNSHLEKNEKSCTVKTETSVNKDTCSKNKSFTKEKNCRNSNKPNLVNSLQNNREINKQLYELNREVAISLSFELPGDTIDHQTCIICGNMTSVRWLLLVHLKRFHVLTPQQYLTLLHSSPTERSRSLEQLREIGTEPTKVQQPKMAGTLPCHYCGAEFVGIRNMKRHLKLKHRGRISSEEMAEKIAYYSVEYGKLIHQNRMVAIRKANLKKTEYLCRYCNMVLSMSCTRSRHELYTCKLNPNRKKRFHCNYCGTSYSSKDKLDKHQLKHAQHDFKYVCDMCGKECKTKPMLYEHKMKEHHGRKPRYPCAHCDKTFHYKDKLDKHLLCHSNTRDVMCDICGKLFKTKTDVQKHARHIHDKNYPYHCDKCGHGMAKLIYLQSHRCGHVRRNQTDKPPSRGQSFYGPQYIISGANTVVHPIQPPPAATTQALQQTMSDSSLFAEQTMLEAQQTMSETQQTMSEIQKTISYAQQTMSDSSTYNQQKMSETQQSMSYAQQTTSETQLTMSETQQTMSDSSTNNQQTMSETQQTLSDAQQTMTNVQQTMSETQQTMSESQPTMSASSTFNQQTMSDSQQTMTNAQQTMSHAHHTTSNVHQTMPIPVMLHHGTDVGVQQTVAVPTMEQFVQDRSLGYLGPQVPAAYPVMQYVGAHGLMYSLPQAGYLLSQGVSAHSVETPFTDNTTQNCVIGQNDERNSLRGQNVTIGRITVGTNDGSVIEQHCDQSGLILQPSVEKNEQMMQMQSVVQDQTVISRQSLKQEQLAISELSMRREEKLDHYVIHEQPVTSQQPIMQEKAVFEQSLVQDHEIIQGSSS